MNDYFDENNEQEEVKKSSPTTFLDMLTIAGLIMACVGGLALTNVLFGTPFSELKGAFIFFIIGIAIYGIGRAINDKPPKKK